MMETKRMDIDTAPNVILKYKNIVSYNWHEFT